MPYVSSATSTWKYSNKTIPTDPNFVRHVTGNSGICLAL